VFDPVIQRRTDRRLLPLDRLDLQGVALPEKLTRLAYHLPEHALDAEATELHRLITAEAVRIPNLARLCREHAASRYVAYVSGILHGDLRQAERDASNFLTPILLPLLRTLFSTPEQVRSEIEGGVI
jgi:hypothetical protein